MSGLVDHYHAPLKDTKWGEIPDLSHFDQPGQIDRKTAEIVLGALLALRGSCHWISNAHDIRWEIECAIQHLHSGLMPDQSEEGEE